MYVATCPKAVAVDFLRVELLQNGFDPENVDTYINVFCTDPFKKRLYCEYLDIEILWE